MTDLKRRNLSRSDSKQSDGIKRYGVNDSTDLSRSGSSMNKSRSRMNSEDRSRYAELDHGLDENHLLYIPYP